MVTDLRYALRQLERAQQDFTMSSPRRDCIQRAIDALERCMERAVEMEVEMDAMIQAEEDEGDEEYVECVEFESPKTACQCGYCVSQRETADWTIEDILDREG